MCTSEKIYCKAKHIYLGATHQAHITENKFEIQTNYILARLTINTSPKIHSKPKKIIFWRDSQKACHRKFILKPRKLYFDSTHQGHINENKFEIETHKNWALQKHGTMHRMGRFRRMGR